MRLITRRLRSACALSVLISGTTLAQARVVSAPPEPSLLNITRTWSRASSLGDLRELKVGSDYLELRVWGGYGLTMTTQAVVLRRTGRQWSAYLARVLRCEIKISKSVGDTASRATMQRYIAEARRECGKSVNDLGPGAQVIATDSLIVDRLAAPDSAIGSAWKAAVGAGVLQLPARVERHRIDDDAFMYVVELRRGSEYRASVLEHVEPPETEADRQIKDIHSALSRLVPAEYIVKP